MSPIARSDLGRIYLDHNATAPLRPEARAAMLAALDLTGNAASVHGEGRRARAIVERARDEVAALVGAKPEEVVFTSGATEANNWVMRAGWNAVATSTIEHDSVLAPARASQTRPIELPADASGVVGISSIIESLGVGTLLSLHLANGETGVVQPLEAAVASSRTSGGNTIVHTDAVQAIGRIPVDFASLGADLMSISAHKIGGPQGIGALVVRDGIDLPAFIVGGGQQRRRRSGTENVAAAAGFGAAATAARAGLGDMAHVAALRDRLENAVRAVTPDAIVVGAEAPRLPNTSCLALPGADAATLLIRLDLAGFAVSAGSACSSGKIGGSHVLAAMGLAPEIARSAIRLSLGYSSTAADVDAFVAAWQAIHRTAGRRTAGELSSRPPVAAARSPRAVSA